MFFILFLLIVPWVGKFYNEYGLELLPRSGGRGACGSLCICSAELAVEAALGFWYSLCAGLSSVLFSQEVSGVRETWVNLSFPYHRDLQVWKADCLWASFRGQGHRGLRNYAKKLFFFSCDQTVSISSREVFQCVWCSGTAALSSCTLIPSPSTRSLLVPV